MAWGLGVLGAGPGVSALHLPTLAYLADSFRVVHIADGGSGRARALAQPLGADWSRGDEALLGDARVEVVAICTPPAEHARQVRAAVAAGKRAVFCEKPLALDPDDAAALVDLCRDHDVALVVGTNHLFDPAWGRVKHHLLAARAPVEAITVTVALPPNDRYHRLVTDPVPASGGLGRGAPDWTDREVAASVVRQLVIGLGIHDLPLLRDLAPRIDRVLFAQPVEPVGYTLGAVAGDTVVQLTAVMVPAGAEALWRMSVLTAGDLIDVDFRPAFVHDGSAEVRVRHPNGQVTVYPSSPVDGYVEEWRALARVLDHVDTVEYAELLADAVYAVHLADAAADVVRAGRDAEAPA